MCGPLELHSISLSLTHLSTRMHRSELDALSLGPYIPHLRLSSETSLDLGIWDLWYQPAISIEIDV